MKIIGLSGDARAGKDTVGEMIVAYCQSEGIKAKKDSFAAKLKVSAAAALGQHDLSVAEAIAFCDRVKAEGAIMTVALNDGEIIEFSGREFLQWYGTDAHRKVFSTDFWVDALFSQYNLVGDAVPDVLVLTDCRFPNEATACSTRGGEVWEVIRPDNPDALSDDLKLHASENGLPAELITRTIDNSVSMEGLWMTVEEHCQIVGLLK